MAAIKMNATPGNLVCNEILNDSGDNCRDDNDDDDEGVNDVYDDDENDDGSSTVSSIYSTTISHDEDQTDYCININTVGAVKVPKKQKKISISDLKNKNKKPKMTTTKAVLAKKASKKLPSTAVKEKTKGGALKRKAVQPKKKAVSIKKDKKGSTTVSNGVSGNTVKRSLQSASASLPSSSSSTSTSANRRPSINGYFKAEWDFKKICVCYDKSADEIANCRLHEGSSPEKPVLSVYMYATSFREFVNHMQDYVMNGFELVGCHHNKNDQFVLHATISREFHND